MLQKPGHWRPASGATTAVQPRPRSRVPGSPGLGKLCRNLELQGFRRNPRAPNTHLDPGFRSPLDRGWVGSGDRERYVQIIYYYFLFVCLVLALALVYPLGLLEPASPADADKLCPFATNLGSPAECRVTARGRLPGSFPTPLRGSSRPGPLLRSRGAPLTPGSPHTLRPCAPGGHSPADPPLCPGPQKDRLGLTFIRGVHPGTGDSVANPKEKRKENEIENPSHGSPVPTLLLPLLSQWNKCLS